jgi:hypothetical protein
MPDLYIKMNFTVFIHSFPLMLESYPQLAEWGAYSPHKVYSLDDVRELVTILKAFVIFSCELFKLQYQSRNI